MAESKRSIGRVESIPPAPPVYEQRNESEAREKIRKAINKSNEMSRQAISRDTPESSLALRRFQFLLMGASGP